MFKFDQATLDSRNEELANKERELGDREAMAQTMADEREAENLIAEESSLSKGAEAARLERASTALAFQPQRRQKDTRAANSMESMRSLPRSQTAPGELPFVAASYRREFFDFEINYIASPPLSKNVRLVPLKEGRTSNMKVPASDDEDEQPEPTELEAKFDGAVVR